MNRRGGENSGSKELHCDCEFDPVFGQLMKCGWIAMYAYFLRMNENLCAGCLDNLSIDFLLLRFLVNFRLLEIRSVWITSVQIRETWKAIKIYREWDVYRVRAKTERKGFFEWNIANLLERIVLWSPLLMNKTTEETIERMRAMRTIFSLFYSLSLFVIAKSMQYSGIMHTYIYTWANTIYV